MIDSQNHPLDEVEVFGCTVHGLVRADLTEGQRRFVDGVPWPLAGQVIFEGQRPLQLVRMPGIAPVPLTAPQLAAERAAGRVWQNYALLLTDWYLFGQNIGGWIYWASDGVRWVIRPGVLPDPRAGQPYSLTLDCQPFGYYDAAPAPGVELSVSLADIQQEGTAFRRIAFETINSTGSRAILRLTPFAGGLPTGFLEISVGDVGGVLNAGMAVHISQEDVRGEWSTTHPGIASAFDVFQQRSLYPRTTLSGQQEVDGLEVFPIGGGEVRVTVVELAEVDAERTEGFAEYGTFILGVGEVVSGRAGRVLSLQFDDADVLREFSYETEYRYTYSMPSPTGSASGELAAEDASEEGALVPVEGYPMGTVSAVTAEASRTISERITRTVRLVRDGVALVEVENTKHYAAFHELSLAVPAPGYLGWCFSRVGGTNDIDGVGVRYDTSFTSPLLVDAAAVEVAVTATAELGGPWPREWVTAPSMTTGNAAPQYAGEVPVGTDERDADAIGLNFLPVTYAAGRAGEAVTLVERELVGGTTVTREICIAYAHAQVDARGAVASGDRLAYHPLTHELVTDTAGGMPVTFI